LRPRDENCSEIRVITELIKLLSLYTASLVAAARVSARALAGEAAVAEAAAAADGLAATASAGVEREVVSVASTNFADCH
jgi:hypothetical protein